MHDASAPYYLNKAMLCSGGVINGLNGDFGVGGYEGGYEVTWISNANGINDGGMVVGQVHTLQGYHGFLYINGKMVDLNSLAGGGQWTITEATGINNNGQIAAYGYRNDFPSSVRGLLLTPIADEMPVVHAGGNQDVWLPNVATLSGSVSDDGLPNPPGAITVIHWSVVGGPGTVTFGDASSPTSTATFSTIGLYTLRLSPAIRS